MAAQPQLDDETLQRLLDGDLDPRQARDARKLIAESAVDGARVRSYERLTGMMRGAADDLAGELDADAMFKAIEAGIASAAPGPAERAGAWWRGLLANVTQGWMPVAGAGVVAAAVLLTFYLPQQSDERAAGAPGGAEPAAVVPEAATGPSSEVVQVDFGANAGTLFEVALAGGRTTPVVWINEDMGGGL